MQRDTSFLLREATAADIPALHSLLELSVRGLQKGDYSPAQIDGAIGHTLGLDTQLIEDRTYFVAEPAGQSGVIVGCGGWSYRRTLFGSDHGPNREDTFLDPKADAAKIRAIFVHPDWARRGLGTLILGHCEEAARRAGFSKLEMGSTLTGVPLYSLKGYVARERVDVPLPNGEALPVVHMVKDLVCKVCGNDTGNTIIHTKERMLGLDDPFDYLECGACGCIQLIDIPPDMQRYYPRDAYYSFTQKHESDRSAFSFSTWIRRIQAEYKLYDKRKLAGWLCCLGYVTPGIYHYLRKVNARYGTSILDIGCGNGDLLFRLKEIGFRDLTGADPFIDAAMQVPGINIFKSDVFGLSGKYDFIMMNHAFEHMDQPEAVLKKAHELLADKGCLMIRVPVSDAHCWQVYREYWAPLDPPRHFYIHSTRSMGILAAKTGFFIKELLHDATAFQFWGSEQYIKGIPLIAENSYNRNRSKSIFTKAQIRKYRAQIAVLNKSLLGGDAVFFLSKE